MASTSATSLLDAMLCSLVGSKVDAIEWACEQVHELNTQLEQRRKFLA
jgi:hypothetical protein